MCGPGMQRLQYSVFDQILNIFRRLKCEEEESDAEVTSSYLTQGCSTAYSKE